MSEIYPETPAAPDDLPRDTSTWLGEAMQAASDAYRTEHGYAPEPLARMGNTERQGWGAVVRAVDALVGDRDMRIEIPAPEPEQRFALVEQMGFRRVYGTVRETELVGKKMLEVTELGTGQVRLVGGDSLYQVTWMTRDQAESAAITGTRSVAAIGPAVRDDPWGVSESDGDEDDGERDTARRMDALDEAARLEDGL